MLKYKKSNHFEVIEFSNFDFVGCMDRKRSTLGFAFLFVEEAILCRSSN